MLVIQQLVFDRRFILVCRVFFLIFEFLLRHILGPRSFKQLGFEGKILAKVHDNASNIVCAMREQYAEENPVLDEEEKNQEVVSFKNVSLLNNVNRLKVSDVMRTC